MDAIFVISGFANDVLPCFLLAGRTTRLGHAALPLTCYESNGADQLWRNAVCARVGSIVVKTGYAVSGELKGWRLDVGARCVCARENNQTFAQFLDYSLVDGYGLRVLLVCPSLDNSFKLHIYHSDHRCDIGICAIFFQPTSSLGPADLTLT